MHIYIAQNGASTGPYDEEQVRAMLGAGVFSPDDLAWRDGMPDWQPLHVLLDLRQPPPLPTESAGAAAPHFTMPSAERVGVGGWLVFFCVGLTIISPLMWLAKLAGTLSKSWPAFAFYPS